MPKNKLTNPQYSTYLREFVRLQESDGMIFFLRLLPNEKFGRTNIHTSSMKHEWFYKPFFLN